MKIKVERVDITDTYTGGRLYVNGGYFCDTIEDADRKLEEDGEKVYGKSAIPRGTYQCVIDFSGKFQKELPRLLDVQGFEGIRIHSGNSSEDSLGCILVGKNQRHDWVSDSRNTIARLMELLNDAYDRGEDIEVEVV